MVGPDAVVAVSRGAAVQAGGAAAAEHRAGMEQGRGRLVRILHWIGMFALRTCACRNIGDAAASL